MLKFDNLNVSYRHQEILHGITEQIPTGCITTIIGPNGCGKTTLISSITGGSDVTGGRILLDDTDILKLSCKERAKLIAFLPQVRQTIPALPVKTLVEHGRFPHLGYARRKSDEDIRIVNDVMHFTGIEKYKNMYVNTLSGGIRQRVFFAMILAQDCDTIILDEPTTYLDIEGQRIFYQLILDLKKQGKTILLILHDISKALSISDKIIIMNNSEIIFSGLPADCISSHMIEEVFHAECRKLCDEKGTYYLFE